MRPTVLVLLWNRYWCCVLDLVSRANPMMYIFHFPTEVLCDITSWLDADSIARLWIASPNSIGERLTTEGSVRNWTSRSENASFFRFPRLLPLFRSLDTVRLLGPIDCVKKCVLQSQIRTLPPTLTRLELSYAPCSDTFFVAFSNAPSLFDNLKTLTLGALRAYSKDIIFEDNLRYPPNLETLILRNSLRFSLLNPHSLPARLHTFAGYFLRMTYSAPGGVGCFPASLTSLDLELEISSPKLASSLPSGLTHLSLECEVENGVTLQDWRQLPKGLKSLESNSVPTMTEDLSFFPFLPQSLESLVLWTDAPMDESLDLLPATLTSLEGVINDELTSTLASRLPRKLTYLGKHVPIPIDSIPFLPPRLTELSITDPSTQLVSHQEIETAIHALTSFPLRKLAIDCVSNALIHTIGSFPGPKNWNCNASEGQ